jgi:hypothetical protein
MYYWIVLIVCTAVGSIISEVVAHSILPGIWIGFIVGVIIDICIACPEGIGDIVEGAADIFSGFD